MQVPPEAYSGTTAALGSVPTAPTGHGMLPSARMATPAGSGVSQPEKPKRRQNIACTTCFSRKSRCDGLRPCGKCVESRKPDSCVSRVPPSAAAVGAAPGVAAGSLGFGYGPSFPGAGSGPPFFPAYVHQQQQPPPQLHHQAPMFVAAPQVGLAPMDASDDDLLASSGSSLADFDDVGSWMAPSAGSFAGAGAGATMMTAGAPPAMFQSVGAAAGSGSGLLLDLQQQQQMQSSLSLSQSQRQPPRAAGSSGGSAGTPLAPMPLAPTENADSSHQHQQQQLQQQQRSVSPAASDSADRRPLKRPRLHSPQEFGPNLNCKHSARARSAAFTLARAGCVCLSSPVGGSAGAVFQLSLSLADEKVEDRSFSEYARFVVQVLGKRERFCVLCCLRVVAARCRARWR